MPTLTLSALCVEFIILIDYSFFHVQVDIYIIHFVHLVDDFSLVTPMCYRKWQIGQPNNYGNEQNYVALINHAWDDVIGYPKRFFFICEKDLRKFNQRELTSEKWQYRCSICLVDEV